MWMAKVHILLKAGVRDNQGAAVNNALKSLGFNIVNEVRIGKYIELDLSAITKEEASFEVEEMCKKLLANSVIERYNYKIVKKR